MKCMKKRYITLVEMMIVMFLIAMITGVIAYNYTGSLEEGKAFKTKAGIQKIETILALESSASDIDHIDKSFGQLHVSQDLSMEVEEGSIFGYLGANGAGKTTTPRRTGTPLERHAAGATRSSDAEVRRATSGPPEGT